jgi:signal transduction histidine kinase
MGLVGMQERLAAAGGRLTLRSEPGAGTWVDARVPRAEARAE